MKNNYFKAFFFSLILGAFIIVPSIIAGKGILTLIADFNFQQIPFNELINSSIKNGSFLWTWFNDLGSNFIGTFSFYNLTSPFVLIGLLFPADWFCYLIGPIFILKYGIAGLTSYMFLQRYVKDKRLAILGSLLYSFSGFQLTNTLFYHFHDVVALFPLLLYSLDRLVYDNKKHLFAICVALMAFTNYFFFIGEVVFLVIYYFVKVFIKEYNFSFKNFGRILFEGIIGVGIAMVILLPTLYFVVDNPRISNYWSLRSMLIYPISNYLEIIRAFIFPSDVMSIHSVLADNNYRSVELFLPFVGSLFVFTYLVKRPKSWMSILFIVCLIFMFIPILNSSFFAFTTFYYARWFYMVILMMSLMSIKCLDEEFKTNSGFLINICLFVILGLGLAYVYFIKDTRIIFNKEYFILYFILAAICLVCTYFISRCKKHKLILLMLGIIIYVIFRGNYFFYQNKGMLGNDNNYVQNFLNVASHVEIKNDGYRIDGANDVYSNIGYLIERPYLKTFNSNINGSNFEFYRYLGLPRTVTSLVDEQDTYLHNFLSVKYLISLGNNEFFDENYEPISRGDKYYVYENKDAYKMGIGFKYYMNIKEFDKLEPLEKKKILDKAIILNDKQIKKYSSLLSKYKECENCLNEFESNEFSYGKNSFTSNITSAKKSVVLYSIPYDEGWKATVNGKNANIQKVDHGMMAIEIEKGKNEIKFTYFPKGLKAGIIISIISCLVLLFDLIICRRKRDEIL